MDTPIRPGPGIPASPTEPSKDSSAEPVRNSSAESIIKPARVSSNDSLKDSTKSSTKAQTPRQKKRKRHPVLLTLLVLFLLLGTGIGFGIWYYMPSTVQSTLAPAKVIFYDTPVSEADYRWEGKLLMLRLDFVKEKLDPAIYWEADAKIVIVATADSVIEMKVDRVSALWNSKSVPMDIPVKIIDGSPFLPVGFLASTYGIRIDLLPSGVTVVDDLKKPVLSMLVKAHSILSGNDFYDRMPFLRKLPYLDDTPILREAPSFRSPRIKALLPGEEIIVVGEENNWYKIRSADGILGFLMKSQAVFKEIIPAIQGPVPAFIPWKPLTGKINLTWDYMSTPKKDMSKYVPIPGLNVISPTWFSIEDKEGKVKSNGSTAYIDWAKKEGLQVWALFSNNFDPVMSTPVLRSYEVRKKVIQQILTLAGTYDFDGINLDFENIEYEDKDFLTQFVRELTPFLHARGLTVSMDVTIRSASENWSMVYDRVALSRIVDYIAVMTYDEHGGSGPAGSVASLPWVKRGVVRILEQIPAEKLLLGVPFYARVWEEALQKDGTFKTSSAALTMASVQKLIKDNQIVLELDAESGQYYGTFIDDGDLHKIWVEDAHSMRQRIALIEEFRLAGIASWRKGFETPDIWTLIKEELSKIS